MVQVSHEFWKEENHQKRKTQWENILEKFFGCNWIVGSERLLVFVNIYFPVLLKRSASVWRIGIIVRTLITILCVLLFYIYFTST